MKALSKFELFLLKLHSIVILNEIEDKWMFILDNCMMRERERERERERGGGGKTGKKSG